MMDRRLLELVPEAKRHVLLNVLWQWVALLCGVCVSVVTCLLLAGLMQETDLPVFAMCMLAVPAIILRSYATKAAADESFEASCDVRRILRERVLQKVLAVGPAYMEQASTAEVMELAVEGAEQLETYFGQYLPQLFYAVVAPLTLFLALLPVSIPAACVLLAFVPLIPAVIVLVQRIAKRILGTYWGEYMGLADNFLENLQGLSTLKAYQADAARHERMDGEAEHFRVITMKVLTMQLNSIIVMDIVALGGAVAGLAIALWQLAHGAIDLYGCLLVVLLSAEFFIPMRRLGSYFHVAMNGMAAAERIFALLALEEPAERTGKIAQGDRLSLNRVSFGYDDDREVLHDVSLEVEPVGITALVGESGSGKSTIAALLAGREDGYEGDVLLGRHQLRDVARDQLARYMTVVGTVSHLFQGTVRGNLAMADPDATDEQMWKALRAAAIADVVRSLGGLDAEIQNGGENLSGGQRQRLALARALLRNSPVYVFDEATSNVDVESEEAMMRAVHALARNRAVVVISHRLANVTSAKRIYVLDDGRVVGEGTHDELLASCPTYRELWEAQRELERYGRGERHEA